MKIMLQQSMKTNLCHKVCEYLDVKLKNVTSNMFISLIVEIYFNLY